MRRIDLIDLIRKAAIVLVRSILLFHNALNIGVNGESYRRYDEIDVEKQNVGIFSDSCRLCAFSLLHFYRFRALYKFCIVLFSSLFTVIFFFKFLK